MTSSKRKKIFIIAILMASITTSLFYLYLQKLEKQKEIIYEPVVIATQTILERTKILPEMVRIESIPQQYKNKDACSRVEEVIGKHCVNDIFDGQQILKKQVVISNDNIGLSISISEGMRAISIKVDEVIGVGQHVAVGDYVDVVVVMDENNSCEEERAKLILEHIQVLAIGSKLNEQVPTKVEAKTYTLCVTPEEGKVLTYATEKGKIRLLLRPYDDNEDKNDD